MKELKAMKFLLPPPPKEKKFCMEKKKKGPGTVLFLSVFL